MSYRFLLICQSAAFALAMMPLQAQAQAQPDVLVLGDSQISFGAGETYLRFFNQLPELCKANDGSKVLHKLGSSRTAAIGVRSTSLHSWTDKSGEAKDAICEVDKKYGVNAGAYGIAGSNKRKFIQIGQGAEYQFCKPDRSAFEVAFADGYYKPKLLVLAFLGNSAERWADDQAATDLDIMRTTAQIPDDIPCIILTTTPVFSKKTNDLRQKAQDGIAAALDRSGGRCEIVKGFTPDVRAAIEGKAKFFKRNSAGRVTDPHHPSLAATNLSIKMNIPQFCNAVLSVLK